MHNEYGRFFDEVVYKKALAARLPGVQTEVGIDVCFQDFRHTFFIDLLVDNGGVFELKAVDRLNARHRSQLLQYLMLTEQEHGKLINFRPGRVEHEFVNAVTKLVDRRTFQINSAIWRETSGFGNTEKEVIAAIVNDWGTGLDVGLYERAFTHFLGGVSVTQVAIGDLDVAQQKIRLCAPGVALKVTTLNDDLCFFEKHAKEFLKHTTLNAVQWVNVGRNELGFTTLS